MQKDNFIIKNNLIRKSGGKMEVKLTERDIDVLRMMARAGVLCNRQVKRLYGNPKRFHIRKLEKFQELGYVVRDNGYSQVTRKGMAALGIDGTPKRLRKIDIKKRVRVVDLIEMLPDWDVKLGYEVKAEEKINRNAYLDAAIKRQERTYVIYLIDAKEPRPVTLGRLWNEIQEMPLKGLSRVLMLFEHATAMGLVAAKVKKPRIEELLLLPYPDGIELFNTYHGTGFIALLQNKLPGLELLTSDRLFADYQWQGNYVSVLITNDAVKRYCLHEYYNGLSYQTEKKDVVIVCTSDQRTFFANLYPLAKIVSLDRNSLIVKQETASRA